MNETDYPLVSAIMLAGRTPLELVQAAIKSFVAQTYPYKELIIINNASSQYKAAELEISARKNVYLMDTPVELSAGMARNYGISAANGKIMAQYDPCFYHNPKRLESQIVSLVQHEADVSILTETLTYSFITNNAGRYSNALNAILGTMVFIRPAEIDYDDTVKNEEYSLLHKMKNRGAKLISMAAPELMLRWYYGSRISPVGTYFPDNYSELEKTFVKSGLDSIEPIIKTS